MDMRIPFLIPVIALLISAVPVASLTAETEAEKIEEVIDRTTPEGRAASQTQQMKKELGLNQDQIDKVREINLKYARKVQTTVDGSEEEIQELRQMQEIGEEKDREMKAVLSAEQFSKYLAMKEQIREKIREASGG